MVRISEMARKKYVTMIVLFMLLSIATNKSQAQNSVPTYTRSQFVAQFVENNEYDPTLSVSLDSDAGIVFENVSGIDNQFLNDLELKVAACQGVECEIHQLDFGGDSKTSLSTQSFLILQGGWFVPMGGFIIQDTRAEHTLWLGDQPPVAAYTYAYIEPSEEQSFNFLEIGTGLTVGCELEDIDPETGECIYPELPDGSPVQGSPLSVDIVSSTSSIDSERLIPVTALFALALLGCFIVCLRWNGSVRYVIALFAVMGVAVGSEATIAANVPMNETLLVGYVSENVYIAGLPTANNIDEWLVAGPPNTELADALGGDLETQTIPYELKTQCEGTTYTYAWLDDNDEVNFIAHCEPLTPDSTILSIQKDEATTRQCEREQAVQRAAGQEPKECQLAITILGVTFVIGIEAIAGGAIFGGVLITLHTWETENVLGAFSSLGDWLGRLFNRAWVAVHQALNQDSTVTEVSAPPAGALSLELPAGADYAYLQTAPEFASLPYVSAASVEFFRDVGQISTYITGEELARQFFCNQNPICGDFEPDPDDQHKWELLKQTLKIIAATGANVVNIDENQDDNCVDVYRGSDFTLENEIFDDTGYLMSSQAQTTYREAESNKFLRAILASWQRHDELMDLFGSEQAIAEEQSRLGSTQFEREYGLRSMFSVTTDLATAERFGDKIFYACYDLENLIVQTLPSSGENEYFIRHFSDRFERY